jgi:hypothetical protein
VVGDAPSEQRETPGLGEGAEYIPAKGALTDTPEQEAPPDIHGHDGRPAYPLRASSIYLNPRKLSQGFS